MSAASLSVLHSMMLALTAVILFLYGLEHFSREVHRVGATRFQAWLSRVTGNRLNGFLLGAGATAVIQSSSAVTALTVALVQSGTMGFQQSLGVILGANVGTTVTAQLVALKATQIGPVFIVLGFLTSLVRFRYSVIGKTIFYFGFIFFSLDLISTTLLPIRQHEQVIAVLGSADHPLIGVLVGIVATALLQSSSVTTGLAVLLVQQGNLELLPAVAIVMGANIGTTGTALLASLKMDQPARHSAIANLLINAAGVVAFLPWIVPFTRLMESTSESSARVLANAHLVFNLVVALVGLPFTAQIARFVELGFSQRVRAGG